jgi:hypothetical protein
LGSKPIRHATIGASQPQEAFMLSTLPSIDRSSQHQRKAPAIRLVVDHGYVFASDGLSILEKATGRSFDRSLWATRGR